MGDNGRERGGDCGSCGLVIRKLWDHAGEFWRSCQRVALRMSLCVSIASVASLARFARELRSAPPCVGRFA